MYLPGDLFPYMEWNGCWLQGSNDRGLLGRIVSANKAMSTTASGALLPPVVAWPVDGFS